MNIRTCVYFNDINNSEVITAFKPIVLDRVSKFAMLFKLWYWRIERKNVKKHIFVIESAVVCVIGVPLGIVTSMRVGRELRMRIAVCRCVLFGFYCRCWKKLTLALQVVYRTREKWRLVLHFAITVDVVVIESANSYRFNYKINTHTQFSHITNKKEHLMWNEVIKFALIRITFQIENNIMTKAI